MATLQRFCLGFGALALFAAAAGCAESRAPSESAVAKPRAEAPAATAAPAAAPEPAGEAKSGGRARRASKPAEDRPGLGTEWGETRSSQITTVSFERAKAHKPFATASLFYNDEQGARAMAGAGGFRRTASGAVPIADGAFTVGL